MYKKEEEKNGRRARNKSVSSIQYSLKYNFFIQFHSWFCTENILRIDFSAHSLSRIWNKISDFFRCLWWYYFIITFSLILPLWVLRNYYRVLVPLAVKNFIAKKICAPRQWYVLFYWLSFGTSSLLKCVGEKRKRKILESEREIFQEFPIVLCTITIPNSSN